MTSFGGSKKTKLPTSCVYVEFHRGLAMTSRVMKWVVCVLLSGAHSSGLFERLVEQEAALEEALAAVNTLTKGIDAAAIGAADRTVRNLTMELPKIFDTTNFNPLSQAIKDALKKAMEQEMSLCDLENKIKPQTKGPDWYRSFKDQSKKKRRPWAIRSCQRRAVASLSAVDNKDRISSFSIPAKLNLLTNWMMGPNTITPSSIGADMVAINATLNAERTLAGVQSSDAATLRMGLANLVDAIMRVLRTIDGNATTPVIGWQSQLRANEQLGKAELSTASVRSNQELTTALVAMSKNLRGFDSNFMRLIKTDSAWIDADAARSISAFARLYGNLAKQLAFNIKQIVNTQVAFNTTVLAAINATNGEFTNRVQNLTVNMRTQAKRMAEALKPRLDAIGATHLVKVQSRRNRYEERLERKLEQIRNVLVSKIRKQAQTRRLNFTATLDDALESNLTIIDKTVDSAIENATVEWITPAINSVNQSKLELEIINNKFVRDVQFIISDASNLMAGNNSNQIFSDLTTVMKQYEADWMQAKLASAGDFHALSSEFQNRLASVSAAMLDQVADLQDAAAGSGESAETLFKESMTKTTTTIDDVNKYMSGATVHLSNNTEQMKDLLITKKAELKANVAFLKDFLLGGVTKTKEGFTQAINDLAGVVQQMSVPAVATKSSAAASEQKHLVDTQMTALMTSADVKADTLAQLMDAAAAGNYDVFRKLYNQILASNKALAAAVSRATELAGLTAEIASETSVAKKQFLLNKLQTMMTNSTTAMQLLRGQVTAQISQARTALMGLVSDMMNNFGDMADQVVSMAKLTESELGNQTLTKITMQSLIPLVMRLDNLNTKLVPGVVAAFNTFTEYTQLRGQELSTTLDEFVRKSQATGVSMSNQFASDSLEQSKARMNGTWATANTHFNSIKNDTDTVVNNATQAGATLSIAKADFKAKLGEFQNHYSGMLNSPIVSRLQSIVGASKREESNRIALLSPASPRSGQRFKLVIDGVNGLYAKSNSSIRDAAAAFANVSKGDVRDAVDAESKTAHQIADNFTARMRQFDEIAANNARDLLKIELDSLDRAWKNLGAVAPAVNESLKTAAGTNLRAVLGERAQAVQNLKETSGEAYRAAMAKMQDGRDFDAMFNDIEISVQSAVNNSQLLSGPIFEAYSQYDLSDVAESVISVGSAAARVASESASLTYKSAEVAEQIEQAATAEQTTADSLAQISMDAVSSLLAAFSAKKLAVSGSLSAAQTALVNQTANLQSLVTLWHHLVEASMNFTDTGFDEIGAMTANMSTDLQNKSDAIKDTVSAQLTDIETSLSQPRTDFFQHRSVNSALVGTITDRLTRFKSNMTNLEASIAGRNQSADSALAALNSTHVSYIGSLSSAVSGWKLDLTSAVQDALSKLRVPGLV